MGEVRVQVRVTNYADEALAEAGHLSSDDVRSYEADALVDTGAVRCVIPPFILQQLCLKEIKRVVVESADGRTESVPLCGVFTLDIMGRQEPETAVVIGDEFLVGQTALEKMDLLVDCTRQRLVGNPAHPDQPINKIK